MRLHLTIELPENLPEEQRQVAAKAAQEAAILRLFRDGAISKRWSVPPGIPLPRDPDDSA